MFNYYLSALFCCLMYHMVVIDIDSTLVFALCCCATLLLFSVSEVKRQAVIALKVMKTLSKTLFESVKGDSEAKKKN